MLIENIFTSREQLYEKVTQHCLNQLKSGLQENGKASFIVPGGTTPAPVFNSLSKQDIGWENITIAPSDERWLDATHSASNEKLVKDTLLINHAQRANFIGLKNSHNTALAGESECHHNLKILSAPIDIVMVGMGPDGHFASLFPGTEQISEALNLENKNHCIAINAKDCPVAGEYTQRMSMTLAALLNSKSIVILFTGEEKLQVLRKAAKEFTETLPVSALLNQQSVAVELFWAP